MLNTIINGCWCLLSTLELQYVHRNIMRMVYYSIAYAHLQYAITCWGNASAKYLNKLQVKQNKLVRLISNKIKRKTKLLPMHMKNNFLKIRGICKME